ncbi:MAG: SprB repeat-containing protein [Crocinitomicaceae bacterium]|nr:SprB repeat-containing protein [Crocinitomicaceae bacterium]MCH2236142.1 SprB repeat-containing protein [Crocinitomicaceae bacterium]
MKNYFLVPFLGLLLGTSTLAQEANISWRQLQDASFTGEVLERTSNRPAYAVSTEILYGNSAEEFNNGYLKYITEDDLKGKQIGFSELDNQDFKSSELKYSFHFYEFGEFRILESGRNRGSFTYEIGDELIIERVDDNVNYKKNSEVIRTVRVDPRENLFVEAIIKRPSPAFTGAKVNFSARRIDISATVNSLTHSIDLSVEGANGPFTYLWSNGATSQDVSFYEPGEYGVTVTDIYGNQGTKTFNIKEDVEWDYFTDTEVSGSTLQRTGTHNWGGAKSSQSIPAENDAWVEYTLTNSGGRKAVGFAESAISVRRPQDMRYGFYFINGNKFKLIVNGNFIKNYALYENDVFRVERVGEEITFYRNGEVLHQISSGFTGGLAYSASIYSGQEITAVRGGRETLERLTSSYAEGVNLGAINVSAPEGTLPYTYLISTQPIGELSDIYEEYKDSIITDSAAFFGGKVSSLTYSFEGLPQGNYYIAVFDNEANKLFQGTEVVAPEFTMINSSNLHLTSTGVLSMNIASTGETAYGEGLGTIGIKDYGGVSFTIKEFGDLSVGLSPLESSVATNDDAFGIYMHMEEDGTGYIAGVGVEFTPIVLSGETEVTLLINNGDFIVYFDGEQIQRAPIDLAIFAEGFKWGTIFRDKKGEIVYKNPIGKYNRPRPIFKPIYPECGINEGQLGVPFFPPLMLPGGMSVSGITLTNNHTGDVIDILYGAVNGPIPVGSYTLQYTYSYSYTGVFGTMVIGPITASEQLAMGYPVVWEVLLPGTTQYNADPSSLAQIGVSTSSATIAESEAKTIPGVLNWFQFESVVYPPYPEEYFSYPATYQQMRFQDPGTGATLMFLTTSNTDFSTNRYYGGDLIGTDANNLNPQGVFRFDEEDGTIGMFYEGASFYTATSPLGTGPYYADCFQYGKPVYKNMIASFCADYGPFDQYIQPTREPVGGYFLLPEDNVLKVEFFEEYALAGNLNYKILNWMGDDVSGGAVVSEEFGDNRLDITVPTSLLSGYYMLELINDKGENWFIRFKK